MLVKADLYGSYAVHKQKIKKLNKKTLIDWILIAWCNFNLECIIFLLFLWVVNKYGFVFIVDARAGWRMAVMKPIYSIYYFIGNK